MIASYKFFRVKNGICSFAQVSIECVPSDYLEIKWAPDVAGNERIYGNAVREGVSQALRCHQSLGGCAAKFSILALIELPVDTKDDAVVCASAAAAWAALGHPETDLVFTFNGTWNPSITPQMSAISTKRPALERQELEFFFRDMEVGLFRENNFPTKSGRYRYEPYRGPGHYDMQQELKAGREAQCFYHATDGSTVRFSVLNCPEYGLLELSNFSL